MTFDTEFEDDAASIVALAVDVPATYFWTGDYARRYPELLRRLAAQGHTIGSHSFYHDDLTTLSAGQVQFDLEQAKMVLEDIAGVPVTAFRAPFLKYNDPVMAMVEQPGYLVDSSEESPWPRNRRLPEIAVSVFENLLVSDYDIFESRGLDDATGLDFLIRAYSQHAARGQPFVILLHPRIIGRHAGVIRDFIDHVEDSGGRFRTLNAYLDDFALPPVRGRVGIWAELEAGDGVDALLAEAEEHGATDLFLSLPDVTADRPSGPTLAAGAVAAIQARSIQVHLAFPLTQNPTLAGINPKAVMADTRGKPSPDWVSPSHPEVRQQLIGKARELVSELGVDGLYLYGLGYPGLAWDFSPAALQRFSAATAVSGVTPAEILSLHYLTWTQWRSSEVALLVTEIATAARSNSTNVAISISLPSGAATDYRMQELSGRDYRRLGGVVDMIVLSTSLPFSRDTSSLARSLLATRTQAGSVPILVGVDMHANQTSTAHFVAAFPTLREFPKLSSGTVVDIRAGEHDMRLSPWPDLTVPVSDRAIVELVDP